jgi:LPXTG-site transpeptidase (sortase) family protein
MPNTGFGDLTSQNNESGESTGTLIVPSIRIKAKIEAVGLATNDKMNVPANAKNAGWYKLGVKPGESGNAVLAGHLNTFTRSAGVFKKLNKLKAGDDVFVTDGQNKLHFKVSHTEVYDTDSAPLGDVFGSADGAHLNLITCAGDWDNKLRQYTQRLVVYTDLVQ